MYARYNPKLWKARNLVFHFSYSKPITQPWNNSIKNKLRLLLDFFPYTWRIANIFHIQYFCMHVADIKKKYLSLCNKIHGFKEIVSRTISCFFFSRINWIKILLLKVYFFTFARLLMLICYSCYTFIYSSAKCWRYCRKFFKQSWHSIKIDFTYYFEIIFSILRKAEDFSFLFSNFAMQQ